MDVFAPGLGWYGTGHIEAKLPPDVGDEVFVIVVDFDIVVDP